MKLGSIYRIVYQTIILNSKEMRDCFEAFLVHITEEIELETISKPNAKCMASTIIDAKLAKKFKFDYRDDYVEEDDNYQITFAFRESEQEKFIQKVNAFWTEKNQVLTN